jgi:hypothetical protein
MKIDTAPISVCLLCWRSTAAKSSGRSVSAVVDVLSSADFRGLCWLSVNGHQVEKHDERERNSIKYAEPLVQFLQHPSGLLIQLLGILVLGA